MGECGFTGYQHTCTPHSLPPSLPPSLHSPPSLPLQLVLWFQDAGCVSQQVSTKSMSVQLSITWRHLHNNVSLHCVGAFYSSGNTSPPEPFLRPSHPHTSTPHTSTPTHGTSRGMVSPSSRRSLTFASMGTELSHDSRDMADFQRQ